MPRKRIPSKIPTGVIVRHSRSCATVGGGGCDCTPSFRAFVFDRQAGKPDASGQPTPGKVWRTFPTVAAAVEWREENRVKQRRGEAVAPSKRTLRDVAEEWLAGAKSEPPTVVNRSGRPYKPSVLRGYEADLNRHVLPDLGAVKLNDVRRGDLQRLVDRLLGDGASASKVRNTVISVRVVFRHAVEREYVERNPTSGLRLPNGVGHRERTASPDEAGELLAALPEEDRALWATAFYAGLRRGELRGLRSDDVDLASGTITVRRSWDDYAGEISPKSAKGLREVPIVPLLRDYLAEAKARTGRAGQSFVFGSARDRPFTPSHIRRRAAKAWDAANAKRIEENRTQLQPIGLHECRHTFVSMMAASGVPLERIGDYVGHSSVWMVDAYRHLVAGQQAEDMRRFDEYLARADTAGRIEQLEEDA